MPTRPSLASVFSTRRGGTPPPPPSSSIYWGSWIEGVTLAQYYGGTWQTVPYDTGGASQNRFESDAAKTMSMGHFGNGDSGSAGFWTISPRTAQFDTILSRNCYPLFDISTGNSALTSVTAGNFDSAINTWFTGIKNWGKPIILRLNWEMQGSWFPWGAKNTTDYINSWRHIVTLCNNVGATNVSWNWCPNYVLNSTDATLMHNYYPGDAYVDWAGFDVYQDDAKTANGNSQGSYMALSNLTYTTQVGFTSKPQLIGECGCWEFSTSTKGGPTTKGAWLTDMFAQIQANQPKVRGVVYFNWNAASGSTNAIESSAGGKAGFQAGIADSYYKPKLASVNSTGKVPVP